MVAVALISGLLPAPAHVLSLYAFVCLALFCLGLGMLLSAAMVFFRDIQFLWGVLTTIWMHLFSAYLPCDEFLQRQDLVIRQPKAHRHIPGGNGNIVLLHTPPHRYSTNLS